MAQRNVTKDLTKVPLEIQKAVLSLQEKAKEIPKNQNRQTQNILTQKARQRKSWILAPFLQEKAKGTPRSPSAVKVLKWPPKMWAILLLNSLPPLRKGFLICGIFLQGKAKVAPISQNIRRTLLPMLGKKVNLPQKNLRPKMERKKPVFCLQEKAKGVPRSQNTQMLMRLPRNTPSLLMTQQQLQRKRRGKPALCLPEKGKGTPRSPNTPRGLKRLRKMKVQLRKIHQKKRERLICVVFLQEKVKDVPKSQNTLTPPPKKLTTLSEKLYPRLKKLRKILALCLPEKGKGVLRSQNQLTSKPN